MKYFSQLKDKYTILEKYGADVLRRKAFNCFNCFNCFKPLRDTKTLTLGRHVRLIFW